MLKEKINRNYTSISVITTTTITTTTTIIIIIIIIIVIIIIIIKGSGVQSVRFTSTYILDMDTNLADSKHPTA